MITIRLTKLGRKKLPIYGIVVTNKRSARDGQYIDKLGTYNASTKPGEVRINEEKVIKWLKIGAQMSTTVRSILSKAGILLKWHLEQGVIKGKIDENKKKAKVKEWEKINEKKINKTFNYTFI